MHLCYFSPVGSFYCTIYNQGQPQLSKGTNKAWSTLDEKESVAEIYTDILSDILDKRPADSSETRGSVIADDKAHSTSSVNGREL